MANTRALLGLLVLWLLVAGCGAPPTATPDAVGTQVAISRAAVATLTAEAPTATNTPVPTDTPSPTSTATATLIPTFAPTRTPTPIPTRTPRPTPTYTSVPVDSVQWVHYSVHEQAFELDYPGVCGIKEFDTGYEFTAPQGWGFWTSSSTEGGYWDIPLNQLPQFLAGLYVSDRFDLSLDSQFSEVGTLSGAKKGAVAYHARYKQVDGTMIVDSLAIKCPSRLWTVVVHSPDESLVTWTDNLIATYTIDCQ